MTDSSTACGYFPTRRRAKRTPSRYGKASSERTSSWGNQDGGGWGYASLMPVAILRVLSFWNLKAE